MLRICRENHLRQIHEEAMRGFVDLLSIARVLVGYSLYYDIWHARIPS